MAAKPVEELSGSEKNELLCVYSAMICHDSGVSVTVDNINALVKAAGGSVPPFYASLFSKLCDSHGDLSGLMKFSGGGPAAVKEKEIWSEFNVAFRAKGRERLKLQSSSLGAHDSSRSVKEGDQLKLQSSSLRAHDSSRSVNLRACARLPQKRDEPRWEEGEASRSTCLRVVDSEEDPELHETPGVSSTDHLTENAGSAQGSGNDQGGGDGDPARSTSLRAADSKGASSASVTTTNQTETVKTDDKKKKKRRGKPQKKLTGNQREKRRHENQENGEGPDDSEPDWD